MAGLEQAGLSGTNWVTAGATASGVNNHRVKREEHDAHRANAMSEPAICATTPRARRREAGSK